jgi:hypothetical protein
MDIGLLFSKQESVLITCTDSKEEIVSKLLSYDTFVCEKYSITSINKKRSIGWIHYYLLETRTARWKCLFSPALRSYKTPPNRLPNDPPTAIAILENPKYAAKDS